MAYSSKMLQCSTMTSRKCVLKKKCVFIFGFFVHSLSCSSCLNSNAWPFQPKYNLKLYLISRQANNLLLRRYRTRMLHLEEVLCELNRSLFTLSACSYLSWLLSWAGRPPPTCFCSPPPCPEDASHCSLHALSWPHGQPRTGPEKTRKCDENETVGVNYITHLLQTQIS